MAADLGKDAASRLYLAMRKTLETAIRSGAGSEQAAERLPKDFLLPQRHRGGLCPVCGKPLVAAKRGGRTSYACPHCQKPARAHA
jgi:formamidopyrimidine-DNA glycosylase